MEKLKAFFQSTITKVVAWLVLALSIVILFIGGATKEHIDNFVVLVIACISAVGAIIAFITNFVKKK